MIRVDIERAVAKHLLDATGIKTVLEVPKTRPDEFISVEMTGGSGDRFIRRAVVAVQSWAKARQRASEIARIVESKIPDLADDEENVFSAVATGSYRWPDPDSRQERYQTTVEITICE